MKKIGIASVLLALLMMTALSGCESVKKPTVRQIMNIESTSVEI